MLFRIIDVETTGVTPSDEVCEVGFCDLQFNHEELAAGKTCDRRAAIGDGGSCLVKTSRPMPAEAQAVHHISDQDLAEYGVSFPEAWAYMLWFQYGGADERTRNSPPHTSVYAYVAHNATFERQFIGKQWTGNCPWICTMKCALRSWPELPAFGNQVLRYALNLPLMNYARTMPVHAAAPDAYVTAHILAALLERHSVDELIKWTDEPAHWPRLMFGKHKGLPWAEVPDGYLSWMATNLGEDGDVSWHDWQCCARLELQRRRGVKTLVTSRAVK